MWCVAVLFYRFFFYHQNYTICGCKLWDQMKQVQSLLLPAEELCHSQFRLDMCTSKHCISIKMDIKNSFGRGSFLTVLRNDPK